MAVGGPVGILVGVDDGSKLGLLVGVNVGMFVGVFVGKKVGLNDGISLGMLLGIVVGELVGTTHVVSSPHSQRLKSVLYVISHKSGYESASIGPLL